MDRQHYLDVTNGVIKTDGTVDIQLATRIPRGPAV